MLIPIEPRIFVLRGRQVMLDRDLAMLYGVTTGALNQAVRRNIERFPEDFMFKMNQEEFENWKSQIVISNSEKMGLRHFPSVFTEQGIAMLSTVLRSPQAIQVNIQIMRTFVKIRQMIASHEELRMKLDALEMKYDEQFKIIFEAMRRLIAEEEESKGEIGF